MRRKLNSLNFLILSFIPIFLFSAFGIAPAEEVLTINTYYPLPYGDYNHLTTHSDTYLATDGGNVGIGTTSPEATLHVSGTAIIPGLIGQIETVSPATDASTTSTSFVDMPGMSITLTTRANSKLLIFWNVTATQDVSNSLVVTRVLVDGIQQGPVQGGALGYGTATTDSIGGNAVATVATADSHTIKLQWSVSRGLGHCNKGTYPTYYGRTLTVVEVYQ